MTEIVETAEAVADIASRVDIPLLACFMGEARVKAGVAVLESHNIPNYAFPEKAARVFQAMIKYRDYQLKPLPVFETMEADRDSVRETIDRVLGEGRVSIGDAEARTIITAYGMDIPPSEIAETPERAAEIASEMGYPVVLKIASPDILHKTDVGGVKVGLGNPTDVRDAFELMTYRAQRYLPEARLWGCLVQKMVPPGLEILIGMNRDPQFGPLVTFGLGGIYVEILKDVAFRVAPYAREEVNEMLSEIRTSALLDGVRGEPPVDREAIIDAIMRVGQLVIDFPEIAELDINPFVVYPEGQGGIAIDMRLILIPNGN